MNDLPYQVICVARNCETQEEMAVYQALYGEFACFVKPLDLFLEEWNEGNETKREESAQADESKRLEDTRTDAGEAPKQADTGEADDSGEQANPVLLEFLDADTLEEKYKILKRLGSSVTNRLIDDFAVVLDLVIPDGNLDDRYQQLLNSVRTRQKYENTRFLR